MSMSTPTVREKRREAKPVTYHNVKNGKEYTLIRMCVRFLNSNIQVAHLIRVRKRPYLLEEILRFSQMERELYKQVNRNVPIQWLRQRLFVHIGEDAMDFANLLISKERKILDDCVCNLPLW